MKNILIVEDDMSIHSIIEEMLKQEHYSILNAYSGTEALMLLEQNQVDLILLDLMLPGLNGEEIIKRVNHMPIIVISAKMTTEDKVNCLSMGANDYITKPFAKEELLARIKVQLRDSKVNFKLTCKNLKLLTDCHILMVDNNHINLTKTEYAIMKHLLLNINQVVTKTKLLDLISLDTDDGNEESLRVHISNLRNKIRKYTSDDYIESVWGVGFMIKG
ncbi:MAG: response regulator transcription factor [Bacilli bacterium]|nr:response regulator transcription factor [Bacilli bacterium]MCI9434536.1 response regulator transcription factor [Bacilli bacterium]